MVNQHLVAANQYFEKDPQRPISVCLTPIVFLKTVTYLAFTCVSIDKMDGLYEIDNL